MPTNAEFLSPVLALVAWTLVMWIWMYATRIPAMNAAGLFYALMFFAAMTGGGDATALKLAWAYVIIRVLHSLVQATINRVIVRFSIFALGSIVLMIFTFREVMRVMG
jgi:hypothetical protein